MKTPQSDKGAASALAVIGIIIVAWTIGMMMEPLVEPKKEAPKEILPPGEPNTAQAGKTSNAGK